MNRDKHIWEGWTIGDFIDELEPSFDTLIKLNKTFIDRDHLKNWVKGMQPYYKNHIPEVYNYFLNKTQL